MAIHTSAHSSLTYKDSPSPSPRASSPDQQHSTSNSLPTSTKNLSEILASSEQTNAKDSQPSTLTPTNNQISTSGPNDNATAMCGPLIDSSPLSSPPSTPTTSPPQVFSGKVNSTVKADSAGAVRAMPGAYPDSPTSATSMSKKRARDEDQDENKANTPPPKKTTAAKAKSNAKATVALTATRSSTRNRKPPPKHDDYKEPPKKSAPPHKPTGKVFDPVYATTNANSRFGKADIYHMLLLPTAWDCLTIEQQRSLVNMLPKNNTNDVLLAKLQKNEKVTRPKEFTLAFDCFRTDVAKFVTDLKSGHLSKTWLAAAEQAVVERAQGAYDAWKVEEAEAWWGQKAE